MMRTTQLKSTPYAHRWGCIVASSLGAAVPTALIAGSRLATPLRQALAPARLAEYHSRCSGAFPSVQEASWLPQQKLTLWSSNWMVTRAQAGPRAAPIEADTAKADSATQSAASSLPEAGNGTGRTVSTATDGPPQDESSSGSTENGVVKGEQAEQLCFQAAAALIPHPDKVAQGGEDAHFISDNGLALGVADGVGGWAEVNVDAGIYSRLLMSNAKKLAERTGPSSDAPQEILIQAHSQTDVQGSSTACIVMLDGATLRAVNLGDSGFLVLRNDQIVFRSPSQQHQFNFPYQLAGPGAGGDSPLAAETFSVGVKKGDVVVLATDGLIDNVYPQEAASVVSVIQRKGDPPRVAASGLAEFARMRSMDKEHLSPFAYGARMAGWGYMGGKPDDITVVVAYVSAASQL